MSYITTIGTAVPQHRFSQDQLCEFMIRAMNLDVGDARKLKAIFKSSGIAYRHSVLEDYGKQRDYSFYSNSPDFQPFPNTESRLEVYRSNADAISQMAVRNALSNLATIDYSEITHLVVVSCTGLYAPGLDIDLVRSLNLRPDVQRTCINFMGCYAAFNAIKIADAFCRSGDAKVLIVCTEMCSLHFQKEITEDNMLANTLFADGAAAILMETSPREGLNLSPEVFHNALSMTDDHHMAWSVGSLGFEMKLSSYVPAIIQQGIKKLSHSLLQKVNKQASDIAHYAIHPGGKRILEVIERELGISKDQNIGAYDILRNYGNMSSPSVLFVLDHIQKRLQASDNGKHILSFAFGPGLTMESMLLQIQYH